MNTSLKYLFWFSAFVISYACKQPNVEANPKVQLTKTEAPQTTGNTVSKVIGAAGGVLELPAAAAKVTVPVGAMAAGASLSLTPTNNMLDASQGSGIRVTGLWTKPITLEIQIPDPDIANYRLYAHMPNGLWVGAISPKVNGGKLAVRLGPNAGESVKNGRVYVKPTDLVYFKDFYLKPNTTNIEVGKSVQFTAYARVGKMSKKAALDDKVDPNSLTDDDLAPIPNLPTDADDLVPLTPLPNIADDDLASLPVIVKEYAFNDKKEGFTRKWTLSEPIGSISETGKYTAPKDDKYKGKKVNVTFTSTNNKTKKSISVPGVIFINDGLRRYSGTIKITAETTKGTRTYKSILKGDVYIVNSLSVPWSYSKDVGTVAKVENYEEYENDGSVKFTFLGENTGASNRSLIYLRFAKDYKTYQLSGGLQAFCKVNVFCDYCNPKNIVNDKLDVFSDFYFSESGKSLTFDVTDQKKISGKIVTNGKSEGGGNSKITTTWDLSLVE
jgi:hypothetical protein